MIIIISQTSCFRRYLANFLFFIGGPIKRGGQSPLNWIHLEDAVGLLTYAVESDHVNGTINGVAPQLSTHNDLCQILRHKTKRPSWFSLPEAALLYKLPL